MPALKAARSSIRQPYPGLRPFELADAFLFFGREQHTQELLDRLSRNRFLAVVGTSGSGKSSLVRAGLMPALYRGYLIGSSTHWRIAIMRPGGGPLDQLSRALASKQALNADPAALRTRIESSSLGLTAAVREANLPAGENLLLIVDQFEELFRFASESRSTDTQGEALLFVRSLLEAVDQFDVPIYVVITMRTDFLGDCTLFPGLPEALNRSQYLIPRLSREQRRAPIENPVEIAGAEFSSRLVQQILNDVGDDPDQLPVMQHALARMYRLWKEQGVDRPLDLEDYERAGGLESALNDHAQQIYERFDASGREWTCKLFRCLTMMEKGREVRRPGRLDRIFAVVGATDDASRAAVTKIVETYASEENCLLFISPGIRPDQRIVDISHESLIRKWKLLTRWAKEEAEGAECVTDLLSDSRRQAAGEADYWRDPELSRLLARKEKDGWTAAWAEQYGVAGGPGFAAIEKFLEQSRSQERWRRLKRIGTYVLCAVVVLAGLTAAELYRDSRKAIEAAGIAAQNEQAARKNEQAAVAALEQAQAQRAEDLSERQKLEQSLRSGTASAADKIDAQARLNDVNSKLIGSLQKENQSLVAKLQDASKQPKDDIVRDANSRPVLNDAGAPMHIADVSAALDKDRKQRQDLENTQKQTQEQLSSLEAKYKAVQASNANATKPVVPVPGPAPAPAKPAPFSQRLEGNSAVYVSSYDVILTANLHYPSESAELYVWSGPFDGGGAGMAINHNSKKLDLLLGRLKGITCNGHSTTIEGHTASCFAIATKKVSLIDGVSFLLGVPLDKSHLSIIVTGVSNSVDKDKAWLDFTLQPAM